ncbi:MAG: alpha-hydroxy-acid oxidizing protein [Vicinamibacterales bacterium]
MSRQSYTRRQAFERLGGLVPPVAYAQTNAEGAASGAAQVQVAPAEELVSVYEFGVEAQRVMTPALYGIVTDGDRGMHDRITLRPRVMVNGEGLDLSAELFGEKLFAPIMIGAVSDQAQFHRDGELETVRGASAGRAAMVVSSHSTHPIDHIAAEAKTPLWYQVYADDNVRETRAQIEAAVQAGSKAVVITTGAAYQTPANGSRGTVRMPARSARTDWRAIDQLRDGVKVPILIKGVMSPEDAETAVTRGVQGIVVSNFGGLLGGSPSGAIEMLPGIVDAVNRRVPVLVDGGFRRGTDVLKAIALGASAVMLGRPIMWALSAYGAPGIQVLLEHYQWDLARAMAMTNPTIAGLDRTYVTIHRA